MGLDSLLAKIPKRVADTPDTPRYLHEVSAQSPCLLACTPDTPDTPEIINAANDCGNQTTDEASHGEIANNAVMRTDSQEWKPDRCNRCAHLSTFHNGYACRTDNGLPKLFGLLYPQPDDLGSTCDRWKPDRWEIVCPTDWLH